MNNLNFALWRYYRTIRNHLHCSRKLKKRIMNEIKESVKNYLSDHPDSNYDDIETHFGKPLQIAANYVDNMNTDELLKTLYIKRKALSIFAIVATIIVLSWAVAVTIATQRDINSSNGTYEDIIIDGTIPSEIQNDGVKNYE